MGEAAAIRARARNDIVRVVNRGAGLDQFVHDVASVLRRAVPFEGICLLTVDPATLLPTGEIVENGLPSAALARFTEIELGEPDFNKFAALARAEVPAASLSGATQGVLDRSARQREVRRPHGFGDELRTVLGGPTGTWGTVTLLREYGRPNFSAVDVRFMASVAAPLADGVRRAMLVDDVLDGGAGDTGFLVVAPDDTVELANEAAERWLELLAAAGMPTDGLPVAARAVVAQTRHVGDGGSTVASARVRTSSGQWVVVRGSPVGDGRVAVLIESPRPAELASTFADAYGLTERERAVTAQVARGLPTSEIADRLHLSAYTVQDHLKAVFGKSGTSSRGALVARLFFDHHMPLLDGSGATPESPDGRVGADGG